MRSSKPKRGFMDGYKTYDPAVEGFGSPDNWRSAFKQRMGLDEAQEIFKTFEPQKEPTLRELFLATTLEALKKVYYKLMMKHHPDKAAEADKAAANEMAKKINATYTVLEDKLKRR